MKLFVDSANLKDIEEALERGFGGVTTNPSLLAKEPKEKFESHIAKIVDLILRYNPTAHLSVEVFSTGSEKMLGQALEFMRNFGHANLSIKIPIGWDELEVIRDLRNAGISVNCTCNMSVGQALLAATAGADFVSFFWCRIRDGGQERKFSQKLAELSRKGILDPEEDFNPFSVVQRSRTLFDQSFPKTQIIAGSIRSVRDIIDAGIAGAHIVTIPPKFFKDMVSHFKTDEVVNQFLTDFRKWLS